MSPVLLSRLRRITRKEVSWRARAAARTAGDRMAARLRPRGWNRGDIGHALADAVIDEPLRTAIAAGQWDTIHDVLAQRIRGRASGFTLDPAASTDVRAEVLRRWPAAATQAAERADTILAGRYDLLGYRALAFGGPEGAVDWRLDPVHKRRAPDVFWADVPYLDPAIGDHKIIWELNRHQHWLQLGRAHWLTGDPRYARRILKELDGWIAANPPLVGINWASMLEIGLRAISWTWAIHFLLGEAGRKGHEDELATKDTKITKENNDLRELRDLRGESSSCASWPWLVDMLVALDRQLTHVEQNLSVYFSPNTHLTGEALALYVVGVALPELAASRQWAETGRRILLEEIDRQIHVDGGHAERSTHYQRYTLDFYMMALLTARRGRDADAVGRFTDAVTRLAEFTRTMADDAGRLPLIGDDDGGMLWPFAGRECQDVRDSLALAAVLLDRPDLAPWGVQEEVFWIAGRTAIDRAPRGETHAGASSLPSSRPSSVPSLHSSLSSLPSSLPSRLLSDTGYVVVRDSAGSHAVFDAGRHGYLNGGHAHAGALAMTLTLAGRPLLVDPGTSTYTMDPRLRDRLRSSMSHNTVTVDGRSQAIPGGPFHWQTRADASLHASLLHAGFDWVEASHDGYAPMRHRRTLLRATDSGWLVVDEILGEGRHDASTHWHFDPGWMLRSDAPGQLRARHFDGDEAWLLHDTGDVWLVHGDEESGLGWYAPAYGTLIPTWTARIARQAAAPFAMVTWIGGAGVSADEPPSMARVVPTCDVVGTAIGARVVAGRRTSVFLLRPGEPPSHDGRACEILDYQSDARVLHYQEEDGRLKRLDLIDATHARARRDGWISIASEAMTELHATVQDGVLDLEASRPPAHLRVQGAAIRGVRSVRLNHRELPPPTADCADTLVVHGVDWAEASPSSPVG